MIMWYGLLAMPAYLMMVIAHPQWLIKKVEKLQTDFLWSAKEKANGWFAREVADALSINGAL